MRCIHRAKRSWNASAAYAMGERRAILSGCERATGTPMSQMPRSGAQLLATLPKDRQESGRTTDSQLAHLVLQRGSFYAECRCGTARPGDHQACVVELLQ